MTGNGQAPDAARRQLDGLPDDAWQWFATAGREEVDTSERAVLGAMMGSAAAAGEAAAILRPQGDPPRLPQYFGRNAHQIVFETVLALLDAGHPVEPAAVLSELGRTGYLRRNGSIDGPFLHTLITGAGSVGYHAGKVLDAWQQRNVSAELRSCCQIADGEAFDPDVHLDIIRERVEAATAFAGAAALRPQWRTVVDVLDAAEAGTGDPGLTTGFPDLDEVLGGLRAGEMTVLAAIPGSGKTTLALNIADHVAGTLGLPVLFSSLEMREEQLTLKRIAAAAAVPLHQLVRRRLDDEDWARIASAHPALAGSALYVDDTPGASLAQHRGRLAEMTRLGHPARLSVIDHLGLLAAPKAESRQQAVAELARAAKTLARKAGIPLLLVCPMNRGAASRTDRTPRLTDLRDSGEIEGNADNVILLHREGPDSPRQGEVDAIVAKNRMGPLATVTLGFQGHFSRVVSLAPDWSPSGQVAEEARPDPISEHEQAAQDRRDAVAERQRSAAGSHQGQ